MENVTKDMTIADVIAVNPDIASILFKAGMHCVGCPSAQGETLEEAGAVHGIDPDALTAEINQYLAKTCKA